MRSESQRGESSTSNIIESQSIMQEVETQSETISEQKEDIQQHESTIEQPIKNLQEDDTVIEHIIYPEKITSSLEIISKNVVLSQEETRVVETQEEISFSTRVNPLKEPSSSSWDTMPERRNFSLFGNMAEDEERVENEGWEDDQTFGFPIPELEKNVNMENINPSVLPTFHGMSTKDAQKLKLFPTTETMLMMPKN